MAAPTGRRLLMADVEHRTLNEGWAEKESPHQEYRVQRKFNSEQGGMKLTIPTMFLNDAPTLLHR
jgi:hypothetical protein